MGYKRFAIALTFAIAGCGSGPKHVDVSGTPSNLRFTVLAVEGAPRPCAEDLSVGPVSSEDAYPTWQISSLGKDKCFESVRYGELTDSITQKAPATPLHPGVAY